MVKSVNDDISLRNLKLCIWAGPIFVLLFLIGAVPLAGFFPPPSAADTAAETLHMYNLDLTAVRLGCLVMAISSVFFAPWGVALAYVTRRAETGFPILYKTQIVLIAVSTMVILFIPVFWGIGAFRPNEVSPEIVQTWNDAGWFGVLFTWPPFSLWCIVIALAILGDQSETPWMERWVGYVNLWTGLLYAPAGLMIFFKTGVFSQNGLVVFWVPVGIFFVWIITMSWLVLKRIGLEGKNSENHNASIAR